MLTAWLVITATAALAETITGRVVSLCRLADDGQGAPSRFVHAVACGDHPCESVLEARGRDGDRRSLWRGRLPPIDAGFNYFHSLDEIEPGSLFFLAAHNTYRYELMGATSLCVGLRLFNLVTAKSTRQ